jgi:parallel beta-helix repeat protein
VATVHAPPLMRRKGDGPGRLAVPVVILTLALLLLSSYPSPHGAPGSVPPIVTVSDRPLTCQNWLINSTMIVTNKTLNQCGNVTVESAGNLTLQSDALIINGTRSGEFSITVQPGGALYLYNTTVEPGLARAGYAFIADGSRFVMEGSEVRGAGWCVGPGYLGYNPSCWSGWAPLPSAGLVVETNGATIRDSTFAEDSLGLAVTGSSATVENNSFLYDSVSSLEVFQSSGNRIVGNTFAQNPTEYDNQVVHLVSTELSLVANNTVNELNLSQIYSPGSAYSPGRTDGVKVDSSVNVSVINNTMDVGNDGVFTLQSGNVTIGNNSIRFGENGVEVLSTGVNDRIVGNRLVGGALSGGGYNTRGNVGIDLNLAQNSLVDANTITGNMNTGVYCTSTSGDAIVNNIITNSNASSYGILALGCLNNTIESNDVTGAPFGLFLAGGSDNNHVVNNTFAAEYPPPFYEPESSVTLDDSSGSDLAGNNFCDVSTQPVGPYDSGGNTWSLGARGNFWGYFSSGGAGSCPQTVTPYTRLAIPPDGVEPYSESTPFAVGTAPTPFVPEVPLPVQPNTAAFNGSVIKNQTLSIPSGYLPTNLTVINSTLILGHNGTVMIGGNAGPDSHLIVENSRILNDGYGSGLGSSNGTTILIENSTLQGVAMTDLVTGNLTITNSTITAPLTGSGMTIQQAFDARIVNDTISGDLVSIGTYCDPAITNQLQISGDRIDGTIEDGISVCVAQTHSIVISDNNVSSPWGGGIGTSGNASIVGNMLYGVGIGAASDSLVTGNTVVSAPIAVEVRGIDTTIYQNNFLNTSTVHPVLDDYGTGSWDFGGDGNYWSVYSGIDPDLDGIGDVPFVIPNANGAVDHYPFMRESGWLTRFYLTVDSNIPNVPFTINGAAKFSTGIDGALKIRLGYDMNYTIDFPSAISLSNVTRLAFTNWNDLPSNQTARTYSLSANTTIGVNYAEQYLLTVGSSVGSVSGGGWYSPGSTARIRYSPVGGYRFVDWVANSSAIIITDPTAPSTSVTVDGPGTVVASLSVVTYTLTFTESGLPSVMNWSVMLGGFTLSSATSKITFTEPNGTYAFTVGSVMGYAINPKSGSATVNGTSPAPVSVSFTLTSTSPSSSGLPSWVYAVIGVLVAVAAIAAVVLVMRRRRPPAVAASSPAPTPPP